MKDIVEYNGRKMEYKKFRYYVMNKPAGVITATEDKKDKTVMDILPEWVIKKDLFPIGRLDKDTEGVFLCINAILVSVYNHKRCSKSEVFRGITLKTSD